MCFTRKMSLGRKVEKTNSQGKEKGSYNLYGEHMALPCWLGGSKGSLYR